MDEVIYFEGTITTSGQSKRKLVLYIPVRYHGKLKKYVGRRVKVFAVVGEEEG